MSILSVKGASKAVAKILQVVGFEVAHSAGLWKWKLCRGIKDNVLDDERNKNTGVPNAIC